MPKAYQLTINKISDWGEILAYLQSLTSVNYMIACREFAPKTGKEHYHVYIQFKYSMNLSKKKLLSAHIEVCKGRPQANIAYIKKQGDILFEEGEPRLASSGISIKEVKEMTKDERENLPFSHYNKVQSLKRDEICTLRASEYFKHVEVFYIFGPSGAGKTKYAINAIKELYKQQKIPDDIFNEVKYCGNFWNGVSLDNMSKVALYDDFRDYHLPPSEFINFIDYNMHIMNIKYGFVMNKFEYIFITSIQSPYKLYDNKPKDDQLSKAFGAANKVLFKSNAEDYEEESRMQWIRRISQIIEVNGNGLTIKLNKEVPTDK